MLDLLICGSALVAIISLLIVLPEAVRDTAGRIRDTAERVGAARRAEAERLSRIRPVPFGLAEPTTPSVYDLPAPDIYGEIR